MCAKDKCCCPKKKKVAGKKRRGKVGKARLNANQILSMARVAPLPIANPEVPLYGDNAFGEEQLQRVPPKQLTARKVEKYVEVMNSGGAIVQTNDTAPSKPQGFSLVKTVPPARIKTGPATNVPQFLEGLKKRQMSVQSIATQTERQIEQMKPMLRRVNAVELPKPVDLLPPVPATIPGRSRNKVTPSMMLDNPEYNTVLGVNVPIKREGQFVSKKTGLFTVEKRGAPTKD